jgi:nucleoside-diphosphate-sugar epimerase
VADAYDADGMRAAMVAARPDVVLDLLTDIPPAVDPRRYAEQMAGNDRIRRDVTPNVVAGALGAGARRIVAESIAFVYAPAPGLATEHDSLWHDAPEPFARTVGAVYAMERAVLDADGIEGVVLRFGWLYGPGSGFAADGGTAAAVRGRKYPLVGPASGVWSFVHAGDAADAVVAALAGPEPGIYNVVDDAPAPGSEWLPAYAAELEAKPPRRVPVWLARLLAGPMASATSVEMRGASNARAKRELGWAPAHPTWRDGLSKPV